MATKIVGNLILSESLSASAGSGHTLTYNTGSGQVFYTSSAQFDSGIYTPTPTNVTNSGNVSALSSFYSRVNDVVTMLITLQISLAAGQTQTDFNLDLPIPSNFASGFNARCAGIYTGLSSGVLAKVDGNSVAATDNLSINAVASTTGASLGTVYLYVQYQIL
jgi:hypothetical protein